MEHVLENVNCVRADSSHPEFVLCNSHVISDLLVPLVVMMTSVSSSVVCQSEYMRNFFGQENDKKMTRIIIIQKGGKGYVKGLKKGYVKVICKHGI